MEKGVLPWAWGLGCAAVAIGAGGLLVDNVCSLGLTLSPLSGVGGGLFPCLLPDVYLPLLDAGDVLLPCPWPGAGGVLAVYPLPGVGGVGMIVSCCFVGQITTNLSKNFHSTFLLQNL